MTTLQEWKKAKKAELLYRTQRILSEGGNVFVGVHESELEKTKDWLDTSFDELVALVKTEILKSQNVLHITDNSEAFVALKKDDVLEAFARLRGEANE